MTLHGESESGFTLVEMLIGIALLAMLGTLIANGTRVATRAWNTAEQQSAATDDMDAVQNLLRRSIAQARPAFASADPGDRTVAFAGEPDALTLVTAQPGSQDSGPWARERFHVIRYRTSSGLVVNWQFDVPGAATLDGSTNQALLLDHVSAIRFAYFGSSRAGETPTWQETWTSRNRLPSLVRVAIERDNPKLRPWPVLIVGTRITANASCVYDASGVDCQRVRR